MRLLSRLVLLLAAFAVPALAQIGAGSAPLPEPSTLVRAKVADVEIKAGGRAEAHVDMDIQRSWHINSNPPSPDYMIPTVVQIRPAFGVTAGHAIYPAAKPLKVEFDDKPLSVYTGDAVIRVPLTAAASAENGKHTLKGTVRYQACNDDVCTAPTSVPFTVEVTVTGGVAPGTATKGSAATGGTSLSEGAATNGADTAAPSVTSIVEDTSFTNGSGGGTGAQPLTPPPGSDPVSRGGLVAFLWLFGLGLALNLTPCVYPMLGITVSIFGARSAAPTPKVIGSALVYILGIMTMYSTLGTVAALTGQLFGSFLQNPLVLGGIGVLFVVMSLSMFGLYELQPPAGLLQRLGGSGATNMLGLFASGLVVGVFAAPCVGPPVVALLGLVAARGDVWYGFHTFFALALGLSAPYLVLATFSNLLQKLPRSGEWMVWVKKLFGVALLGFGLFYLLNAMAPRYSMWVLPATLLVGGVYLGFLEHSGAKRKGFVLAKRLLGVACLAAGVWVVANAPKPTLQFQPYADAAVQQALASGKPVILDFSADWCIPCHKMERTTFADPRVIAAADKFAAFKVDLTHADSPVAEAQTRRYGIRGIPTIVFLVPGGEVETARFSGELSADEFLEKLRLVAAAAKQG